MRAALALVSGPAACFAAIGLCRCDSASADSRDKAAVAPDAAKEILEDANSPIIFVLPPPPGASESAADGSSASVAECGAGPSTGACGFASDSASNAPPSDGLQASTSDAAADASLCDESRDPQVASCVLSDLDGVFVAMPACDAAEECDGGIAGFGGDDLAGDGTAAKPFASIAQALVNLKGRSRIYLCDGVYAERVVLTAPVSLFGGLSCAPGGWRYDGGETDVNSPSADLALSVVGLDNARPVTIADISFFTPDAIGVDAQGNGNSSIVAWVSSSAVDFVRVVLAAGRGANGADGIMQNNYTIPAPAGGGMDPVSTTCIYHDMPSGPPDSSAGGTAGDMQNPPGDGSAYPPPVTSAGRDGLGMTMGDPGADGTPRLGGACAAAGDFGSLTSTAWSPSSGGPGQAGRPGQGGGGGGFNETVDSLYSGGSGGSGGCGGAGGTGGKGGGASLALVSVASTVNLSSSSLQTSQAGSGGQGGKGQTGQPGALGSIINDPYTNPGGTGGNGAGGGGGGGGSGGISAGILYSGREPTFDPTTTGIFPGLGGAGGDPGPGGAGGTNVLGTAPDGYDGEMGIAGASVAVVGPL